MTTIQIVVDSDLDASCVSGLSWTLGIAAEVIWETSSCVSFCPQNANLLGVNLALRNQSVLPRIEGKPRLEVSVNVVKILHIWILDYNILYTMVKKATVASMWDNTILDCQKNQFSPLDWTYHEV